MGSVINKLAGMMGIGNRDEDEEYEDIQEYEEQDQEQEEDIYTKPRGARKSFSEIEQENPYSTRNIQTKVIPMNTAISSSKMVITQPTCFEDVQEIAEYLKTKKSVIINLENVGKEDARRILDFLAGSAFMIDGTMQKVSNLIYLMTPKNVEIQNDLERSQYKQKASFSWLK